MVAAPKKRDVLLASAQSHLDWADDVLTKGMIPASIDVDLARVRIALALAKIEMSREVTG